LRLAPLSEVPNGVMIGRDVLGGSDRAPLLRAGVALNPDYREGPLRAGVYAVYIDDASSRGIAPPSPIISETTQDVAVKAVAETYAEARAALAARRPLPLGVTDALGPVLEMILTEVGHHGDAAVALRDMCAADAYTFQHSIDVTALGMMLGARVFAAGGWGSAAGATSRSQLDERLFTLGMGLLLHDIGKLAIPVTIIQKSGPLTRAERELVESHPQAGFDLLSDSAWSPLVKAVVLRHHERWDGSGYPGGLRGKEIHEMARIAAVADVFDAVTSERPYARARASHEGIRIITAAAGRQFDPRIARIFTEMVAPFPSGVGVTLTDGRRALVVDSLAGALDRPVVRVLDGPGAPLEIDLADAPKLGIAGW
jgi:HD-GYP domain-containing protein (c-di-GMP phosphodiesterase class II)